MNKLTIAGNFNREYQPDYEKTFAAGQTIRVPKPKRWVVTEGLKYQPQNIESEYTTITIDNIQGIHFEWNTFDQALKMERPNKQLEDNYVNAPIDQLAQTIDLKAAQFLMRNTNNYVGQLGVNPTSMTTYNQARAQLVKNACPPGMDNKQMVLTPDMQVDVSAALFPVFGPQAAVNDAFNRGVIGKGAGFSEWVESMSLPRITAGTWQGAVTIAGSGQTGSTLLLNCTSGDTFIAGNNFTVEAVENVNPTVREALGQLKQFVITDTVVATGSTVTIPIYPSIVGPGATPVEGQYQNVSALPLNLAALTLFDGTASPNGVRGVAGVGFHEKAFMIAGCKLENPPTGGGAYSKMVQDPNSGVTLSFVRFWDQTFRKWTNRWDCAYGFGVGQADAMAVKVLAKS